MSEAGQFLRRIRTYFEQHGIHNEPQIVEHLASLLLLRDQWQVIETLRPDVLARVLEAGYHEPRKAYPKLQSPSRFPTGQLAPEGIGELLGLLRQAIKDSPYYSPDLDTLDKFFQREIRWELLKSSSGPQYPTPYHLASFMAKLGVTRPDARILDPAMGSAGLLIAALTDAPDAALVGADFDPVWAAIGSTNLILNGKANAVVFVGSSLEKFSSHYTDNPHSEYWNNLFDTVLMNPPFGGSRSQYEVAETIGEEFGRNNATVMGALAIRALCPGGRAVFLMPSGVLFASRGAEANLKEVVLAESLEAIITLPKRAFYPYSNVDAHLIVVRKRMDGEAPSANPIWFCNIESDGYPEGSERDLTASPNAQFDELPRVQELILASRLPDAWQLQFELAGIGPIQTVRLSPPNGLAGIAISARLNENHLPKWDILSLTQSSLIKIRDQQGQFQGVLMAPYMGDIISLTWQQIIGQLWNQLLPHGNLTEGILGQWVNEAVESAFQVEDVNHPTFTLTQGRTTYHFTSAGGQPEMACFLNETGQQQSSWLQVAASQKIREAEFGERFSAIVLQDANEVQIGWLLELTRALAGENQQPVKGYLLIVFQDQVDLFENAGSVLGFIQNGYFSICLQDRSFHFEQGQPIRQQDGIDLAGFAIGPVAGVGGVQRMFGALLRRSSTSPNDDLQPGRFLPKPEAVALKHPASVIAEIRKNQSRFDEKVNNLLEILGNASKPASLGHRVYPAPGWIIQMLDEYQKAFLEKIVSYQAGGRSAHFNGKDVLSWKNQIEGTPYSDADALMQLELFTRLGLVMKVHSQGENLYRCLTYQDVVKPQIENTEGSHEAA